MEADAKKKGKNKMRYILILLGLLVANAASAIDCEKVPDCESLGYSTENDPNCAENAPSSALANRTKHRGVESSSNVRAIP